MIKSILTNCLALFILALSMSSCGTVVQNFYFEKDGSGKYDMTYDMSEMLGLIEMMSQREKDPSSEAEEDPFKKMFSNGRSQMDTVMNMYDIMPDSLKDGSPESLATKNWNMRMVMDKEKRSMVMSLETDYSSLSQLGDRFEMFSKMKGADAGVSSMEKNPLNSTGTMTKAYLSNHMKFKKRSLKIKEYAYSDEELKSLTKELEGDDDPGANAFAQQMMEEMDNRTVYHLPGKIKKVKYEGEYTLIDDSTIELKTDFKELTKSGKYPALYVKWK